MSEHLLEDRDRRLSNGELLRLLDFGPKEGVDVVEVLAVLLLLAAGRGRLLEVPSRQSPTHGVVGVNAARIKTLGIFAIELAERAPLAVEAQGDLVVFPNRDR